MLPCTYGAVSKFILKKICKLDASRIDVVFDRILSPSIKDCERDNRAAGSNRHDTYVIAGAAQKRPTNFTAALRNNQFKDSLVKFVVTSWEDKSNADIFNGKQIYATYDDKCYLFKVIDGEVVKEEDRSLSSSHEEADSRMLFHCKNLQGSKNVVVRTNDTDVLIIFLGNMEKLNPDLKIWLEVCIQAQNNLHCIAVKEMFDTLGSDLVEHFQDFMCSLARIILHRLVEEVKYVH